MTCTTTTEPASRGIAHVLHSDLEATVAEPNGNVPNLLWGRA